MAMWISYHNTKWRHILEDLDTNLHRRDKFKSHTSSVTFPFSSGSTFTYKVHFITKIMYLLKYNTSQPFQKLCFIPLMKTSLKERLRK